MENSSGSDGNFSQVHILNKDLPKQPERSFFQKFQYKTLFVFSTLFGLASLAELMSIWGTFARLYQHGLLSVNDLFGFLFPFSLLLGCISLLGISYSYIKNRTKMNRFSNLCALLMVTISVLALILVVIVFSLIILSGGLLLLTLGASPLIPSQVTEVAYVIYFLAFIGLTFSFSKEHKTERLKIVLPWLIILVIGVSWLVPQFINTNSPVINSSSPVISESSVKVSAVGSTVGWNTYDNPQMGISFMYPSAWPTPDYYGIDGYGNPDLTVSAPYQPKILDIEIGQKTSGESCGECVSVPFNEAVSSYNSTSPSDSYKVSLIDLNGRTYTLFTNSSQNSFAGGATIFVPNDISPDNYAVINANIADQNTLYLFLNSFRFLSATTTN